MALTAVTIKTRAMHKGG